MPIPDTVLPPEPTQETNKTKSLEEICEICNNLLKKQLICKNLCMLCKNVCAEFVAWDNLGDK